MAAPFFDSKASHPPLSATVLQDPPEPTIVHQSPSTVDECCRCRVEPLPHQCDAASVGPTATHLAWWEGLTPPVLSTTAMAHLIAPPAVGQCTISLLQSAVTTPGAHTMPHIVGWPSHVG
jgi:hypothetical protein